MPDHDCDCVYDEISIVWSVGKPEHVDILLTTGQRITGYIYPELQPVAASDATP